MDVGRLIYAILFIASIAFFLRNLYRLFALVCLGHWENRFDRLSDRIGNMLLYAFGQLRVIQKGYGINHFIIFWGFLILLLMNGEFLLAGLFPEFSFSFLGTIPYGLLLVATGIMSLVVLVAVAVALVRRIFLRPDYIEPTADAFFILGMIASLMIAYFGYHAGEIFWRNRMGKMDAYFKPPFRFLSKLFRGISPFRNRILLVGSCNCFVGVYELSTLQ
jgi:hypothetical protein